MKTMGRIKRVLHGCPAVVYPGSLFSPAELCGVEVSAPDELCFLHDPDGAEADHDEGLADWDRECREFGR